MFDVTAVSVPSGAMTSKTRPPKAAWGALGESWTYPTRSTKLSPWLRRLTLSPGATVPLGATANIVGGTTNWPLDALYGTLTVSPFTLAAIVDVGSIGRSEPPKAMTVKVTFITGWAEVICRVEQPRSARAHSAVIAAADSEVVAMRWRVPE